MELYRYCKLSDRIIQYIKDRKLYFQNPLNFNDPFECDLNALCVGSGVDFDNRFQAYIDMLIKRNDYVVRRFNYYGKRITDYASDSTPQKERYYFNEEAELCLKESNALLSEINSLYNCSPSKRQSALIDAWNTKKEQVANGLGVVCFSENNANLLMWSHYADSHKGICLIYESEERPILKWKKYNYYKIKYRQNREIDVLKVGFENAFFSLLTTKSPDWEYEKEHRLITIKGPGPQKSRMASIKGIILGARIKENSIDILSAFFDALKELNQKRANSPSFKYYYAEKHLSNFEIQVKIIRRICELRNFIRTP
jgi:hypothetical protein